MPGLKLNLPRIISRNFNFCFFISLLPPALLSPLYPDIAQITPWLLWLAAPAANGLITALEALMFNRYFSNRNFTIFYDVSARYKLLAVAFCAGFMSVYINISVFATWIIALIVTYIAFRYIRNFIARISKLLRPAVMATLSDIGDFANFFVNLILSCAVINLAVDSLYHHFGSIAPFNFGQGLDAIINAVYFSIITITTVGYGDIIPHTPLARIIVVAECLTGYILLGLMIGIITRGINTEENPRS